MLIVCPSCHATNRVPDARLADGPVCGTCKAPLTSPEPFVLDDQSFANYVARTELPIVVDFWAAWCGPCKMMAPQFAAAAKQLEPDLRLAKVDTEAEPALGARFGIRSIPTLLLIQSGKEIARQSGAMGADQIVQWARMQLMSDQVQ